MLKSDTNVPIVVYDAIFTDVVVNDPPTALLKKIAKRDFFNFLFL